MGALHHNGMINLLNLLLSEHQGHAAKCFAGFGEDHRATDGPVEPVGNAKEHITWLVISYFDKLLQQFIKRSITGLITLHNVRNPLVHHHQVVVLIQYGNRRL